MSLLARPLKVAVCTVVALSGCLAAVPAAASDGGSCESAGRSLRYVVAFDRGTAEPDARRQVAAACGDTTVYYPQIAVAVATSAEAKFTAKIGADRAFSAQGTRLAAQRASGIDPASPSPAPARLAPTDPARVPSGDRSGGQWDMRAINAPAAHRITEGRRDVVVGVLDSGVDPLHPDLAAAIDPADSAGCLTGAPDPRPEAWQPTTSVHGTHVAGVIAAADDGRGVTGVAPGVRIASVKVIDDRGNADPEAAVCGLMWSAAHHLPVTNSSWFVNPWSLSCVRGDDRGVVHEVLARAVEYSTAAGTLNVAAATNEAVDLAPSAPSGTPSAPGRCEALPAGLRDVVAVSAVGADRVKTGYSSYGLGVVDVTAPGGDAGQCVLSTVPGGYAPLCGTSMAAPHVAGVLALLKSVHPAASPASLRRDLEAGSSPLPCPDDYDLTGDGAQDAYCAGYDSYNGFYGHGLTDALAAVQPPAAGPPDPVSR
ncbi:S8 family serine peptidase [Amycolatopsis sp. PS_44_ISF1]|uniref:S8 family peptidase n=1 Tax=Amycolatopsis sp. PS_44_ISF1 TaxID=2974917 RepID=UPI0028DF6AD5|nr:S8 family serine peptidase [Amycolatopsis sp. PS_44_ISF1]MDT8914560.1 S8 family serine peptidase [Amycolatopsis sp. PS_44_ISF1]